MADSLSFAFLVLLESLSPEQRAAPLLRDMFDEPYDRIAEIVGKSEQNARQLASRARRHVQERRGGRVRFEASREQREELATSSFAAAEDGDLQGLEELLAHDVVLHGDGGGKAPAIARAIHGRARVARTLIAGLALRRPLRRLHHAPRGGQRPTGYAVLRPRGRAGRVMILDVADGQIQTVNSIVNPDNLQHLGPVADLRATARADLDTSARGLGPDRDHCDPDAREPMARLIVISTAPRSLSAPSAELGLGRPGSNASGPTRSQPRSKPNGLRSCRARRSWRLPRAEVRG